MDKIVVNYVILFVLRQFNKYQASINWSLVKADVDARVAAWIPGTMWDQACTDLANEFLDACQFVLGSTMAIEKIVKLIAAQDWSGAIQALKDLIVSSWTPSTAMGERVRLACVAPQAA